MDCPFRWTRVDVTGDHYNITIFGAISTSSDKLYHMLAPATNKQQFAFFLENLTSDPDFKETAVVPVLIMDNHSAHHSDFAS